MCGLFFSWGELASDILSLCYLLSCYVLPVIRGLFAVFPCVMPCWVVLYYYVPDCLLSLVGPVFCLLYGGLWWLVACALRYCSFLGNLHSLFEMSWCLGWEDLLFLLSVVFYLCLWYVVGLVCLWGLGWMV